VGWFGSAIPRSSESFVVKARAASPTFSSGFAAHQFLAQITAETFGILLVMLMTTPGFAHVLTAEM
jgi:hypothetical protein